MTGKAKIFSVAIATVKIFNEVRRKKSKSEITNSGLLDYKSKGLTIVGIMGGISDGKSYLTNLKKHSYSWKVYREINDEQAIWQKYGIANSGGKQFLINSTGEIIATNPTVEELLAILNN